MPLEPGTRLGPYEVTAKIGEGGMGEVWQARDTTLDRDVALKVLPEAFTADPDRLARFEGEAKVLASLNHPNIGSIYGLAETEGGTFRALVLELVEGPTLAERIAHGPMSLDEALPIARQIAEALEAAHAQGVIHRDLKPANIKVREDGTVKVLDFGLAKAFQPDATDPNLSASPAMSLTVAGTQIGMVIGTAAYMSPEQAKGKAIDKRADIWAFGAVLFEMLAGRKMFDAGDVSEILASVLLRDPDIAALGGHVPAHVRSLLRRCLVKDPKDRLRDIGEIRLALNTPDAAPVSGARTATTVRLRVWQRPAPALLLAGLVALVAGMSVWGLVDRAGPGAPVLRVSGILDRNAPVSPQFILPSMAMSPDGTMLIYRGLGGDGPALYLRKLDELTSERVRGTENGASPVFSPDGASIGFIDATGTVSQLRRVSVVAGVASTIATLPEGARGATWGRNEQIIVGTDGRGLLGVPATGGDLESLTEGTAAARWPFALPDHQVVLFATSDDPQAIIETSQLAALDLATGTVVRLGLAGTSPRYLPTGHLVFVTDDGALQAVAFDPDEIAVIGEPVRVADGIATTEAGSAELAVSNGGRLVYVSGGRNRSGEGALGWVDRAGLVTPLAVEQTVTGFPRLSPDERSVAYAATQGIWIHDVSRQTDVRFAFDGISTLPFWAPDGSSLVFASNAGGTFDIYSKPADSSTGASLVIEDPNAIVPGSLSTDGQLLYHRVVEETQRDLWVLSADGTSSPFLESEFNEMAPRLHPSGRWVAYVSDQSGEDRVYLQPFPDGGVSCSCRRGLAPSRSGRATDASCSIAMGRG